MDLYDFLFIKNELLSDSSEWASFRFIMEWGLHPIFNLLDTGRMRLLSKWGCSATSSRQHGLSSHKATRVLHGVFGCRVPKNETRIVHPLTYKRVCLQGGRKTSRTIAMNGYSHFEKYLLHISLSSIVAQLIIDLHIFWRWSTEIACIYNCLAKIHLYRYCLNNS